MDINNRNLFISEQIINYLQSSYQNIYNDNEIIKKYVKYKELLLKKETSENLKSTIDDSTFFTTEDDEELETLNRYFYGNSDGSSSGDGNNLASSYLSTIYNIKKMIDEHDGNIKDIVVNLTSLLSEKMPDESFNKYLNELIIPGIIGNIGIESTNGSATLQRDIIKNEYSKANLQANKTAKDAELAAEIERKNKLKIKAEQDKQANLTEKKKTQQIEQELKDAKKKAEDKLRTDNKVKQETENKLVFKEKIAKIEEDIKLKIAKIDIIIKSKIYEKSIYLLSKNKEPRKSKEEATKNADKFTDSYAKKQPYNINTAKETYQKHLRVINDNLLGNSNEIKFSQFDLTKKDYNYEKLKNIKKILKQLKNDDEENEDGKTINYDKFKLDSKNNSEEDIKEFNDMIKTIIDKEKAQAKQTDEEEKNKSKLEHYEKRLKQAFAIYQNMYNFKKVYFLNFAQSNIETFIQKLEYLLKKDDKKVGGNKPHESISTLKNIIDKFNVDYDDDDEDEYDEYERMEYDSLLAYIRLYTVYYTPLLQKIEEIKSNAENTDISKELLLLYDEFNKEYNDFIKKHDEMLKNIEK